MASFVGGTLASVAGDTATTAYWLAWLGNFTSIVLILSPLPALKKIWDTGDVGDHSPFAYAAALFNCAVWFLYSFMIENSAPMKAINCIGTILEFLYVLFFLRYLDDEDDVHHNLLSALVLEVILISIVAAVGFFLWPPTFGFVGVASGLAMYATPLCNTYKAYKTRNTQGMAPYIMLLAMLGNGLCWFAYAYVVPDYYVMVPSVVGVLSAGAQLWVYTSLSWPASASSRPLVE